MKAKIKFEPLKKVKRVSNSEGKSKKKLTPYEEKRLKGLYFKKEIDGVEVQVWAPRKETDPKRYVKVEDIVIKECDPDAPTFTEIQLERCKCHLCGKQFKVESQLDSHFGDCEGNNTGQILNKFHKEAKKQNNKTVYTAPRLHKEFQYRMTNKGKKKAVELRIGDWSVEPIQEGAPSNKPDLEI